MYPVPFRHGESSTCRPPKAAVSCFLLCTSLSVVQDVKGFLVVTIPISDVHPDESFGDLVRLIDGALDRHGHQRIDPRRQGPQDRRQQRLVVAPDFVDTFQVFLPDGLDDSREFEAVLGVNDQHGEARLDDGVLLFARSGHEKPAPPVDI